MTEDDRLRDLAALHDQVVRLSSGDPGLARALPDLPPDLRGLHAALAADPEIWRGQRSLHAVHVPSLSAALSLYADLAASGASGEELAAVRPAFARSATLFSDAARALVDAKLRRLTLDIGVLADRAGPAAPPAPAGLFGRARALMPDLSSPGSVLSGMAGDVSARASALARLGGLAGSSAIGSARNRLVAPVSARLSASKSALGEGLGAGAALGVVIGLLCPPLLPLAAGGAVLSALSAYDAEMGRLKGLGAAERDAEIGRLSRERARALRQLTGGAAALRMENEMLSVTLDVETGIADATVLSGPLTGRNVSELDAGQKARLRSEVEGTKGGATLWGVLAGAADAAFLASL